MFPKVDDNNPCWHCKGPGGMVKEKWPVGDSGRNGGNKGMLRENKAADGGLGEKGATAQNKPGKHWSKSIMN